MAGDAGGAELGRSGDRGTDVCGMDLENFSGTGNAGGVILCIDVFPEKPADRICSHSAGADGDSNQSGRYPGLSSVCSGICGNDRICGNGLSAACDSHKGSSLLLPVI